MRSFLFVRNQSEKFAKTLNEQHATANSIKARTSRNGRNTDDDRIKQTNGAVGVKE